MAMFQSKVEKAFQKFIGKGETILEQGNTVISLPQGEFSAGPTFHSCFFSLRTHRFSFLQSPQEIFTFEIASW